MSLYYTNAHSKSHDKPAEILLKNEAIDSYLFVESKNTKIAINTFLDKSI